MEDKKANLVGQKFGMVIVKAEAGRYITLNGKAKEKRWLCICSCGTEVFKRQNHLLRPNTNCGCRQMAPDLTGQKFGLLTIQGKGTRYSKELGSKRGDWWLCICECGESKEVRAGSLKNGSTTSCGCVQAELRRKLNLRRKIGDIQGYLQIIDIKQQGHKSVFICQCICGKLPISLTSNKINGRTNCGCLTPHLKLAAITKAKNASIILNRTHGKSRLEVYNSWQNIKKRPVCPEWLDINAFAQWYEYQQINCPNGKLERIDKTKPYGPNNCQLRDRVAEAIEVSKLNQPKRTNKAKILF